MVLNNKIERSCCDHVFARLCASVPGDSALMSFNDIVFAKSSLPLFFPKSVTKLDFFVEFFVSQRFVSIFVSTFN